MEKKLIQSFKVINFLVVERKKTKKQTKECLLPTNHPRRQIT